MLEHCHNEEKRETLLCSYSLRLYMIIYTTRLMLYDIVSDLSHTCYQRLDLRNKAVT